MKRATFVFWAAFAAASASGLDLGVPVFDTSLLTESNRVTYLEEFRRAGVTKVYVATNLGRLKPSIWPERTERLREIVRFFETNGLEVAVWIGETIGHGGAVEAGKMDGDLRVPMPYTQLTALDGRLQDWRFCPLDPGFVASVTNYVAEVARCGARTILLDDDLRINEVLPQPACACARHLALIRRELGEPNLAREDLAKVCFTGPDNKYRRAFLKQNGESLRGFVRAIRAAADSVDPAIRVGYCSPHSTFGLDGASSVELARILAGEGNRPLLRLHGAPYWANSDEMRLPSVFEIERMFAAISRAEWADLDLLPEGDVYPRPRYHTPASAMELFDAVMRADRSFTMSFKYIFDYHSTFDYERGYVERHLYDLPALEKIERFFSGGLNEGVRVHASPRRFSAADFGLSPRRFEGSMPVAGFACAYAGLPTVYAGESPVHAAFGEDVRDVMETGAPLIVDAPAAVILTRAGVDCGLAAEGTWVETEAGYLSSKDPFERAIVRQGKCRLLRAGLKEGAKVMLSAECAGADHRPQTFALAYRYANAEGRRFLVYLYDGTSLHCASGLVRGYLAQRVIFDGYRFLAGKNPPVFAHGHPDLYLGTARGHDGSLSLLVANCYADPILRPVFTLDRDYAAVESATDDAAHLEGRKLVFESPIPAFDFRAVRLVVKKECK